MLPWQLNWVVKHFGKHLKAQETARDPLTADQLAELDKHDFFGAKRIGRYGRDMWTSTRLDSQTLRSWLDNNKFLSFVVTFFVAGSIVSPL